MQINNIEKYKMNEELINFKLNITTFSDFKLCEIIVSHRYLGVLKDEALVCMHELARRRKIGDDFDFENYIEIELKKLPSFKSDLNQISKIPSITNIFTLFKK